MTSNNSINDEFFQTHHASTQMQTSKKTSSVCISSTSSISESSATALRISNEDDRRVSSPDQFENEKKILEQLQAMTTTTSSSNKVLMQSNSLDITDDGLIIASDLQPPALPPKISRLIKDRQFSQHDLDMEK